MQKYCTPLLGLPQFDSWATFHASDDNCFFFLLSVKGLGAENAGKKLSNMALEKKIEDSASLHHLGVVLTKIAKEQAVEISFVLALFGDKTATFMTKSASILLRRSEKIGLLLQAEKQEKIITGKLHPEDVLVFCNAASRVFFPEVEQKFAAGFETETIISSLLPNLRSHKESSRQAMVFVEVRQETVNVSQELEESGQEEDSHLEELLAEAQESEQIFESKKEQNKFYKQLRHRVFYLLRLIAKVPLLMISSGRNLMRKIFRTGVYLDDGLSTKRQRRLIIFLLIFGLISVLLGIFFWQHRVRQIRAARSFIIELEDKLASAEAQLEIDPIAARQSVEAILSELDSLEIRFESQNFARSRILDFNSQVEQYYEQISGREEFQELPVFFDLRLREDDFIARSVDLFENKAVFLDPGQEKIIFLNLDNKQSKSINISELGEAKDLRFDGERSLLLADGIYSIDLDAGTVSILIEEGDSNREATLLAYFARFIYVFSDEKRNIYRYSEGEEGYSEPIGWLQDKQGLDFKSVKDMEIDGDLWLAFQDGNILKYTQGNPVEFEIRGLSESFNSQIRIFTKTDYEYLYVLDSEKQRLVVLSKEGDVIKELQSNMLKSATELIVNQDETNAFAISGSLLYELEL